jgi:hypothetical protein
MCLLMSDPMCVKLLDILVKLLHNSGVMYERVLGCIYTMRM